MLDQHLAGVASAMPTLRDVLEVALTTGGITGGIMTSSNTTELHPETAYDNDGRSLLSKRNGTCHLEPPYKGSHSEKSVTMTLQWITFAITVSCLAFYAYEGYKGHVGWEEIYVALVECAKKLFHTGGKVGIELYNEWDTSASIYQTNGSVVLWLRYAEWLLSCPVILVHLSNMTGLEHKYGTKTLLLILSDVGCITFGVTCAFAQGPIKVLFFLIACVYGAITYFGAAKIYIQTYHTVPKGTCRTLVKVMAWVYFMSWMTFPIFFVAGPEGLGELTLYGTTIAHTFGDIVSKNLWGFLGHILRVKIREHILLNGDVRKKTTLNVAGEEVEIQTFVDHMEDGAERHSGAELARRASFVKMRETLKKRGENPRLSVDVSHTYIDEEGDEERPTKAYEPDVKKPKGSAMRLKTESHRSVVPGRVMLISPDLSIVDFIREQFASLPASVELVTAASVDMALPLIQQSMMMGGLDFILLHPELLRDTSAQGPLAKLRMMGQRVAAFGWGLHSPMRQLIESAGLDGWLEGPSFGAGIRAEDLQGLVLRMQGLKQNMMDNMGMRGLASMSTGLGGMGGLGTTSPGLGGMGGGMPGAMVGMGGFSGGPAMPGMNHPMPTMHAMVVIPAPSQQMGVNGMGQASHNPLFNGPGSPGNMSPHAGQNGMGASLFRTSSQQQGMATPQTPGGSSVTEADVLAQLLQEISRLKSELGEHP